MQIAWNLAVAVGMLAIFPLAYLGRPRPWMAVALVAAGLPCAFLNHVLLIAKAES